MKIGVIADDFTGASDIALTLAEAGMPVAQFIGVPDARPDPEIAAGVIALKSRTAPVAQAVSASLAACDWLHAQGAEQIIFKVCSTFDSTPEGNIGPVLDALSDRLNASSVIVCPAFPENGRSVYQGHLFVADRLLNESGMQDHPLTPMTDPDLRRVLGAQTQKTVGHIPALTVMQGAKTIVAARADGYQIVDAITDADLMEIGRSAKTMPLLCGGSGIALGLPANFGFTPERPAWSPVRGPGVVLSGSCSRATRVQVTEYKKIAPALQIEAAQAVAGQYDLAEIADWVMAQNLSPLIYSSADPDEVGDAQSRFGITTASDTIEQIFAELARTLVNRGVRRVVVAGGETSGAVVNGLALKELKIGPRATAGVPLVRCDGLALALKSGNFGGPDFFKDALELMETTH